MKPRFEPKVADAASCLNASSMEHGLAKLMQPNDYCLQIFMGVHPSCFRSML